MPKGKKMVFFFSLRSLGKNDSSMHSGSKETPNFFRESRLLELKTYGRLLDMELSLPKSLCPDFSVVIILVMISTLVIGHCPCHHPCHKNYPSHSTVSAMSFSLHLSKSNNLWTVDTVLVKVAMPIILIVSVIGHCHRFDHCHIIILVLIIIISLSLS